MRNLVTISGVAVMLAVSCSPSTTDTPSAPTPAPAAPAPKPHVTVNAKLSCSDSFLIVENLGPETWDDAEMYLNGNPPSAYHYHLGVLQPDHPYKIALRDFSKQDGKRFNPDEYKITVVWIGGGKYDYKSYGMQ